MLPFAPSGFVVKYRARVTAGGRVELLEARKDARTFAHALLGSDAWLHVQFDSLPEGKAPRERERKAQQRLLSEGIIVCGRRFLFFGSKEARSLADFQAYFIAERGEVQPSERGLFEAGPPRGGTAPTGGSGERRPRHGRTRECVRPPADGASMGWPRWRS